MLSTMLAAVEAERIENLPFVLRNLRKVPSSKPGHRSEALDGSHRDICFFFCGSGCAFQLHSRVDGDIEQRQVKVGLFLRAG